MSETLTNKPTDAGTHDANPPGEDKDCRLKDLPAELRNDIFSLAVIEDEPIKLIIPQRSRHKRIKLAPDSLVRRLRPFTGLSLISTCRQFRQEVTQVFYAQNTFSLESAKVQSRSKQSALGFPVAKTSRFIFKTDDRKLPDALNWYAVRIEPKLHVEKLANNTLSIRTSDCAVDDPCICAATMLAERCRGNDSLVTFVKEFRRRQLWYVLRKELDYLRGEVCTRCGKV